VARSSRRNRSAVDQQNAAQCWRSSSDPYIASRLATPVVSVLTPNTALAVIAGNVFIAAITTGLPMIMSSTIESVSYPPA
jgi:hypothetical protein